MESELSKEGLFIRVGEEMTFPNPVSDRIAEIEWKLRYSNSELKPSDKLMAASVIAAYRTLVAAKSQKSRNQCCAAMQAAYKET